MAQIGYAAFKALFSMSRGFSDIDLSAPSYSDGVQSCSHHWVDSVPRILHEAARWY